MFLLVLFSEWFLFCIDSTFLFIKLLFMLGWSCIVSFVFKFISSVLFIFISCKLVCVSVYCEFICVCKL